ncbi:MAG: endospore germination permease [Desulfitobacteriaceae bacterium]|nr:endospore germination permease [Desulfitobacteriaceae bacterium]
MSLEEGKISSSQLTFLILSFCLGSTFIVFPGKSTGQDAWIAVGAGFLEGLVLVLIITGLAMKFPGKSSIQFNDEIFGQYLGKLISLIQIWFLLHLGSFALRTLGDFFITTIFPQTPYVVIAGLLMIICASATRNGVEVIARLGPILAFLAIANIVLTTVLLIPKMDLTNFLPIFNTPPAKLITTGHSVSALIFGETVAFFMIIPFLNKPQKARRSVVTGITLAFLIYMSTTFRDIAVSGPLEMISTHPTFTTVRLIDVGDIFTRLEVLVSVNLLTLSFLKISILLYGTVLGTAQLCKMKSYLPLVFPAAIIMLVLSIIDFENELELLAFSLETWPLYSLPWQAGIPVLSLFVALARRLPDKKKNTDKPAKRL